jgi:hypothetical protein
VAVGEFVHRHHDVEFSEDSARSSQMVAATYRPAWRQPELRQRIQWMRTTNGHRGKGVTADNNTLPSASAPVRALSAQLTELRRRHRDEITELQQALAVAQGENLALRLRLAAYE